MAFDPQDIVAEQKALFASTGQVSVTSGGGIISVGMAGLYGATYGGSQVANKHATGMRSELQTGAFTGSGAGVRDGNAGYRTAWGCGCIHKFSISAVADGRCFVGYTDQSLSACINNTNFLSGRKVAGVGYDKLLGHTTWQFVVNKTGGAHTYVDSGVALAANTPVAICVDAIDKASVTCEIRDATNVVLATHIFDATTVPVGTTDLFEGAMLATPTTGTPADRSILYYGGWNWRRL